MNDRITIRRPELLQIESHGTKTYGADQAWYSSYWKRQAGCGPTTCSHLIWYLSRTRAEYAMLCEHDGFHRDGFIALMDEIWEYVTPGPGGVNRTEIFTKGAVAYGAAKGVVMEYQALQVPEFLRKRPDWDCVSEFLSEAFQRDLPVAFLNLSNGALKNLESWHWVTLTGIDPARGFVEVYDQRKCLEIDLRLWLTSTLRGGGFVVLQPTGKIEKIEKSS